MFGSLGGICGKCGKPFERRRLLFPVKKKDYVTDDWIKTAWDILQERLKHAYILTIFGYGAPKTDVEAVDLMKQAWGSPELRNLEEIEIIDIKNEDELATTWKDFIHTHHYRVTHNFFESWIPNHPRRTCEAMWNQLMEVQFIDRNPVPREVGFPAIWDWYKQLHDHEKADE
jgi:hypothetical protein